MRHRQPDAQRHPDRAGLHAAGAARGRGYASNLVAEVSQAALDGGRRFCFLFTDAANPTSNHVYREIGYEPSATCAPHVRPGMTAEGDEAPVVAAPAPAVVGESRLPMTLAVLILMGFACPPRRT